MQYTEILKSLYRDGFPEDSDAFVDYFFEHVTNEDSIVTRAIGDDIVSVAHIIPRCIKVASHRVDCSYLVAVSTRTEHRGKRLIEQVISDALDVIDSRGEPLALLYPFNHEYYRRYGFVTIDTEYAIDRLSDIPYDTEKCDNIDILYDIYTHYEDSLDVAIHRSRDDMHKRLRMYGIDGGVSYVIRRDNETIGYVIAYGDRIEELVTAVPLDVASRANVQARIVNIPEALALVRCADSDIQVVLHVVDAFRGDRLVEVTCQDGALHGACLAHSKVCHDAITVDVEHLTRYVLGLENIDGLPENAMHTIHMVDKY